MKKTQRPLTKQEWWFIFNIFFSVAIIVIVLLVNGYVDKKIEGKIEYQIQAVQNSIPIVELGILDELPQYQRDVQQCNALASKFVADLMTIEEVAVRLNGEIGTIRAALDKEGILKEVGE